MSRPDFDCIKDYDQFQKYSWSRAELSNICKEHGLLFVGSEKKLNKVIEAYFNGEIIPPRRNWYTNKVLLGYVNKNGLTMDFDLVLLAVSLLITVIGIISKLNGADDLYYVPCFVFGITGLIVALSFTIWGQDLYVKGYFIKGVDCYRFRFIKKMSPDKEPDVGDRVILARIKNGFSLISDDADTVADPEAC